MANMTIDEAKKIVDNGLQSESWLKINHALDTLLQESTINDEVKDYLKSVAPELELPTVSNTDSIFEIAGSNEYIQTVQNVLLSTGEPTFYDDDVADVQEAIQEVYDAETARLNDLFQVKGIEGASVRDLIAAKALNLPVSQNPAFDEELKRKVEALQVRDVDGATLDAMEFAIANSLLDEATIAHYAEKMATNEGLNRLNASEAIRNDARLADEFGENLDGLNLYHVEDGRVVVNPKFADLTPLVDNLSVTYGLDEEGNEKEVDEQQQQNDKEALFQAAVVRAAKKKITTPSLDMTEEVKNEFTKALMLNEVQKNLADDSIDFAAVANLNWKDIQNGSLSDEAVEKIQQYYDEELADKIITAINNAAQNINMASDNQNKLKVQQNWVAMDCAHADAQADKFAHTASAWYKLPSKGWLKNFKKIKDKLKTVAKTLFNWKTIKNLVKNNGASMGIGAAVMAGTYATMATAAVMSPAALAAAGVYAGYTAVNSWVNPLIDKAREMKQRELKRELTWKEAMKTAFNLKALKAAKKELLSKDRNNSSNRKNYLRDGWIGTVTGLATGGMMAGVGSIWARYAAPVIGGAVAWASAWKVKGAAKENLLQQRTLASYLNYTNAAQRAKSKGIAFGARAVASTAFGLNAQSNLNNTLDAFDKMGQGDAVREMLANGEISESNVVAAGKAISNAAEKQVPEYTGNGMLHYNFDELSREQLENAARQAAAGSEPTQRLLDGLNLTAEDSAAAGSPVESLLDDVNTPTDSTTVVTPVDEATTDSTTVVTPVDEATTDSTTVVTPVDEATTDSTPTESDGNVTPESETYSQEEVINRLKAANRGNRSDFWMTTRTPEELTSQYNNLAQFEKDNPELYQRMFGAESKEDVLYKYNRLDAVTARVKFVNGNRLAPLWDGESVPRGLNMSKEQLLEYKSQIEHGENVDPQIFKALARTGVVRYMANEELRTLKDIIECGNVNVNPNADVNSMTDFINAGNFLNQHFDEHGNSDLPGPRTHNVITRIDNPGCENSNEAHGVGARPVVRHHPTPVRQEPVVVPETVVPEENVVPEVVVPEEDVVEPVVLQEVPLELPEYDQIENTPPADARYVYIAGDYGHHVSREGSFDDAGNFITTGADDQTVWLRPNPNKPDRFDVYMMQDGETPTYVSTEKAKHVGHVVGIVGDTNVDGTLATNNPKLVVQLENGSTREVKVKASNVDNNIIQDFERHDLVEPRAEYHDADSRIQQNLDHIGRGTARTVEYTDTDVQLAVKENNMQLNHLNVTRNMSSYNSQMSQLRLQVNVPNLHPTQLVGDKFQPLTETPDFKPAETVASYSMLTKNGIVHGVEYKGNDGKTHVLMWMNDLHDRPNMYLSEEAQRAGYAQMRTAINTQKTFENVSINRGRGGNAK